MIESVAWLAHSMIYTFHTLHSRKHEAAHFVGITSHELNDTPLHAKKRVQIEGSIIIHTVKDSTDETEDVMCKM